MHQPVNQIPPWRAANMEDWLSDALTSTAVHDKDHLDYALNKLCQLYAKTGGRSKAERMQSWREIYFIVTALRHYSYRKALGQ